MDEIKWELIHIPTDPLPPRAPAPALSFLPSADPACIYISCTAGHSLLCQGNAGIFPMLPGSCSPSNTPNPRFCPLLEAPRCAHNAPAPTCTCSDTERGMWQTPPRCSTTKSCLGFSCWLFCIFLILSILRAQLYEELLPSVGWDCTGSDGPGGHHAQLQLPRPGRNSRGNAEKLEQGDEREVDEICSLAELRRCRFSCLFKGNICTQFSAQLLTGND